MDTPMFIDQQRLTFISSMPTLSKDLLRVMADRDRWLARVNGMIIVYLLPFYLSVRCI